MQFKSLLLSAVVVLALAQTTLANIYSQLQFMKIESPKDNQDVRAGEDLTITYVMQPLIDGMNNDKHTILCISNFDCLWYRANFSW